MFRLSLEMQTRIFAILDKMKSLSREQGWDDNLLITLYFFVFSVLPKYLLCLCN